jgi:asparagine synthase (glutamine-hydrolysing)
MCGITGWVDASKNLTNEGPLLDAMTATLAARGPDAAGTWLSTHAALGHRRLAVIDPEHGGQPMTLVREGATHVIVYNGELYNTDELRALLVGLGHTFRTRCDTEVLLAAYVEWGPACLDRLNGIFAFGVWSEREGRLFLARDRLGVKPLFYAPLADGLVFGSELKALLAHPGVSHEVELESMAELLVLGPCRTPGSGVFRGVLELKPGHCLTHDARVTSVQQYWSFQSKPHEDDLDRSAEHVRALVLDAVERQLVSDVPLGTLLSGGLDSSVVTAIAAQIYRQRGWPLRTWSVDYVDNERDFRGTEFLPDPDAPWVGKVSAFLHTSHRRVVLDHAQIFEALDEAARARDLPGLADVDASLLLFCREIKRDATVALSGECADEIFGGYRWFHKPESYTSRQFPWVRLVDERARLFSPAMRARVSAHELVARRYDEMLAEVPRLPGEDPTEAKRREMFYLNLTRFLPMLLDRKDRMSMASGLEVRVPFCDHRIVEYVWNVPWKLKSCDEIEKGLLRRAMQGLLPPDALRRRKSPYPSTHNPGYYALVRSRLLAILDEPTSPLAQVLDVGAARAMADEVHLATERHWFGQYWKDAQFFGFLCQIDAWMRQHKVRLR